MKYAMIIGMLALTACGRGPTGYNGRDGVDGKDGSSCSVTALAIGPSAPNGGAVINCTDGTSSVILNGAPGAPGTAYTTVKLCPGNTAYPSRFVEIAIRTQDKLIAVYSANGGFLTELPPGYYTSNGVGSACNFRVNNDLTISN